MAARYWVGGTDTWDATAGLKWALTSGGVGGLSVPTAADTVFFDAASGANTITLGINADCFSLNMTGYTGTLAFGSFKISVAGTGTAFVQSTTVTVTGTPVVDITNSTATSVTITTTSVSAANAISFNITAGSYPFAHSNIGAFKNLNFTGFSGTWSNTTCTIYGNLTLSTGMTLTAGTSARGFATTTTQTITTNGKTLDFPVTFSGTGTYQLADAMTVGATRATTLTSGTLDLNGKNLTSGTFSYGGSSVRTLAFNGGQIYATGNSATVFACGTATNLTITGTPILNATYSGATGTRNISQSATGFTGPYPSYNISAGTDIVTFNATCTNLDFTGFAGAFSLTSASIYGNLTFSTGMTISASANIMNFKTTSGTQTITTNGKTLDFSAIVDGVGGTHRFADAVTFAATRSLTLTSGTVQFTPGTTNTAPTFVIAGSTSNQIILGSSVAGSRFTLSQTSGTVSASYATISDSIATGGATWQGLAANGAVDGGDNVGWFFDVPFSGGGNGYGVRLRSFTERGRD